MISSIVSSSSLASKTKFISLKIIKRTEKYYKPVVSGNSPGRNDGCFSVKFESDG